MRLRLGSLSSSHQRTSRPDERFCLDEEVGALDAVLLVPLAASPPPICEGDIALASCDQIVSRAGYGTCSVGSATPN
jgi:hypothetical protein